MKKKLVVGLLSALMVTSSISTYAAAAIQIKIDNKLIETDVAPQLKNNITYVPISFIAKELGANTKWESPKVTIEKNGITLEFEIGKLQVIKNGESYPLTNAPYLLKGRTMVPLRAISEHLGCQVGYDNTNKIVSITSETSQTKEVTDSSESPYEKYIDSRLPEEQKEYMRKELANYGINASNEQFVINGLRIGDNGTFYTNRLAYLIEAYLMNPAYLDDPNESIREEELFSNDKQWKIRQEIEVVERFKENGDHDRYESVATLYITNLKTQEEKKICTVPSVCWRWTTDNKVVLQYRNEKQTQYAYYDPQTDTMTIISEDECWEMIKDLGQWEKPAWKWVGKDI